MIHRFARLALVACALAFGGAAQGQKSYVNESLASDAIRLETQLKIEAARLRAPASAETHRQPDGASSQVRPHPTLDQALALVAANPADGQSWLLYARAARLV